MTTTERFNDKQKGKKIMLEDKCDKISDIYIYYCIYIRTQYT